MRSKAELSISLDSETLRLIDHQVRQEKFRNRKQCVEEVVKQWSQNQRFFKLNEEIAAYYRSQSP